MQQTEIKLHPGASRVWDLSSTHKLELKCIQQGILPYFIGFFFLEYTGELRIIVLREEKTVPYNYAPLLRTEL
jgi:hypothetical protein